MVYSLQSSMGSTRDFPLPQAAAANATPFLHHTLLRPDVFSGSAIAGVPVTLKTAWEVRGWRGVESISLGEWLHLGAKSFEAIEGKNRKAQDSKEFWKMKKLEETGSTIPLHKTQRKPQSPSRSFVVWHLPLRPISGNRAPI